MKTYAKKRFSFKSIVTLLNGVLMFKAYADEIDPTKDDKKEDPNNAGNPDTDPKPDGTVNWEDLVVKARQEEKAKLYPKITELEKKRNDLLLVVAERDKEIERLKGELATSESEKKELVKSSKEKNPEADSKNTELNAKLTQLELTIETLKSEHAAELSKKDFEAEKLKMIHAAGDELIPAMITGSTKEEVEASIEASKAEYKRIQEKALGNVSYNTAVPGRQQTALSIDKSAADIQRMSAEEFAEYRKQIGLA